MTGTLIIINITNTIILLYITLERGVKIIAKCKVVSRYLYKIQEWKQLIVQQNWNSEIENWAERCNQRYTRIQDMIYPCDNQRDKRGTIRDSFQTQIVQRIWWSYS